MEVLGAFYQKVLEDNLAGTIKDELHTYDVNHSDGFVVLDARSHERFVTGAAPRLAPANLEHPLTAMFGGDRPDYPPPPPRGERGTVREGSRPPGWVAGRVVPPGRGRPAAATCRRHRSSSTTCCSGGRPIR